MCVVAVGCNQPVIKNASPNPPTERPVLTLDNHGGYSHGGRRILLGADQHYQEIRYTDVIGTEKSASGQYALNAGGTELTLIPDEGARERFYLVPCYNKQYWVREADRQRIAQDGEDYLRQVSLKVTP